MAMELRGCCPLLQVYDMPAALRFYCEALRFTVTNHSGSLPDCGWALLSRMGTELMLNTAYDEGERPPVPDPARMAAHGDTCLYFGWEDLDGLYAELQSKGVNARKPKTAPYGMRQLYLTDPDQYALCFQWPATQAAYDLWVTAYGLEPKTI